ncbi:MAG: NUDIX domain-containing protein [Patescibacteria group bacterium]|nr:NUDIX domain-containing protein [Patescibacteria group bacterium]
MNKKDGFVRAKAIGYIINNGTVFLGFSSTPDTKNGFYTAIGGGIEFGETGAEAVIREYEEETELKVVNPEYRGIIENIFDWEGKPNHEIILVYQVDFENKNIYKEKQVVRYDDFDREKVARWVPISDIHEGKIDLLPTKLKKFIVGISETVVD